MVLICDANEKLKSSRLDMDTFTSGANKLSPEPDRLNHRYVCIYNIISTSRSCASSRRTVLRFKKIKEMGPVHVVAQERF